MRVPMRGAVAANVQDNLISLSAYHGQGLTVNFDQLRATFGAHVFPIALVDDGVGNRVYTFVDALAVDAGQCCEDLADVVLAPHVRGR